MRGENKERRLLYNTVRLMKGCQYIVLERIFPLPTHPFLFSLLLLWFPRELISGMKQAENLFFQRDRLMQVIRLGVNFFQRQLACHFKTLCQLTCTVKPYPEGVWLHWPFIPAPTRAIQQKFCPELLFPLLSWSDINLHTPIRTSDLETD